MPKRPTIYRKSEWRESFPTLRIRGRGPDVNSSKLDDDLDDIAFDLGMHLSREIQARGYKVEFDVVVE